MTRFHVTPLFLLAMSLVAPAFARGNHDNPGRKVGHDDTYWRRIDMDELRSLADRLERDTDVLEDSLDRSLDRSRLDGTHQEDDLNAAAGALEDAADLLGKRVDDRSEARQAVNEVFEAAHELDRIVAGARLDAQVRRDWRRVDGDLALLAQFFPRLAENDEWNRGRWSSDWRTHPRRD